MIADCLANRQYVFLQPNCRSVLTCRDSLFSPTFVEGDAGILIRQYWFGDLSQAFDPKIFFPPLCDALPDFIPDLHIAFGCVQFLIKQLVIQTKMQTSTAVARLAILLPLCQAKLII